MSIDQHAPKSIRSLWQNREVTKCASCNQFMMMPLGFPRAWSPFINSITRIIPTQRGPLVSWNAALIYAWCNMMIDVYVVTLYHVCYFIIWLLCFLFLLLHTYQCSGLVIFKMIFIRHTWPNWLSFESVYMLAVVLFTLEHKIFAHKIFACSADYTTVNVFLKGIFKFQFQG